MRKNFHRTTNPRKAVSDFFKKETHDGHKVYWDKGHVYVGHDQGGVGMFFVNCKSGDDDDYKYSQTPNRFMIIKNEEDLNEVFTHYEDEE